MNEIQQKRIEEVAREYLLKEHISPLNAIMHQAASNAEMQYHRDIENSFINGATYALTYQWISVEEALPEYEECVLAHFEGEDKVGEMFSQRSKPSDNLILDKNGFQVVGFTEVTHWMSIPKLKEGKK